MHRWQGWILGCMFLAFVGIQMVESTHHHESEALQEACAICQMVAHQPLDLSPPTIASMVVVLFLVFIIASPQETFQITDSRYTSYASRAPPY